MGPEPEKRTRTRLVDASIDDIATLDPATLDWDDQERLCIVETLAAPETEDDRAAELEERRRLFRNEYTRLKPASHAVFEALRDGLAPHGMVLQTRLASKRSDCLLLSIRMPDELWTEAFQSALKPFFAFIACSGPDIETKHSIAVPHTERWHGPDAFFNPDPILRDLLSTHVVMLHGPQVDVGASLAPLVDIAIDLSDMPERYLALAVRRAFDLDEVPAWTGPLAEALKPFMFDAACARAARAEDVATILDAFVSAELDDDMQKAEAEKKEKAKPTSVSSSAASGKTFKPEILYPTEPQLRDLHGFGPFGTWASELAIDIAAYRDGRLGWDDVDRGCLLAGASGTGKTFGAQALAATCQVPFIPVSFAQWTAAGRSYQGDVIAAMRATFAFAAEHAPCILFVDEVDSIPSRGSSKEHNDYWVPIVNCKLELLDGTTKRPGVIVIAACNHPDSLDPALVRSGRLDRRFDIGLPDEAALLGIFGHHLPGADPTELAPAATALAGSSSGADVARIAREARRVARRADRAVTVDDILAIAIPADTLSERDRRLVAVHEAGHAAAIMLFGRIPDMVSIVSGGGAHGGVRADHQIGMGRLAEFESEVVVRLAGRAAEEVVLGEVSAGAEKDLQQATSLVSQMIGLAGLGDRLTHGTQLEGVAVETRLRELYGRAVRLLGEHRQIVERLAELALERRVLGRAALVEFAREHGLGGAV